MMTQVIKQNRVFWLTCLTLWIVVGGLMVFNTKEQLIRWVNTHNAPWADGLFPYVTFLGDGIFFLLVVAVLFIRSWRVGLLGVGVFLLSSGLSLLLKRVIFPDHVRPLKYFEHSDWQYHIIKGLNIYSYNSFPSGHTISAFATFGLLALLDARKGRGWVLALLAASVGYSRVYLFQHFVEDVYAGSVIGALSALAGYWGYLRWQNRQPTTL